MERLISGIHHITALASDPQRIVDFYTRVLGLRLVKKTINFDAPDVYHLYFGDHIGTPGTVLTFFPFPGARKGRKGVGEATQIAFSVSSSAISFWRDRLSKSGFIISDTLERFGNPVIRFEDPDGMGIELVGVNGDERPGWAGGNVPSEYTIKGFFGVTLNLYAQDLTAALLTEVLGYSLFDKKGNNRFRYHIDGKPGEPVDIVMNEPAGRGIQSAGSVHHIAFRTKDAATQLDVQQQLLDFGQEVTNVKDRNYFQSIYFREPGGILFEVATDGPGFLVDEDKQHLGENLKLPEWEEHRREELSQRLPKINLDDH